MRYDFRVKLDFSKIFLDARKNSWIYVDSTKILQVHQLAGHIQKLFDIEKPFHLLSLHENVYCFLPFQEDVRVLENNDTVLIVPGTGIENNVKSKKREEKSADRIHNGFVKPDKHKDKETIVGSEKSSGISESFEDTSDLTVNNTFYKTAYPESICEAIETKVPEENITEDVSMNNSAENSIVLNKRKRIRKRKQKISALPDSDTSIIEASGKKPKIIDSILIPSGKHIRFKTVEEDLDSSDANSVKETYSNATQNGQSAQLENKQCPNAADFSALFNLRQQSSTPMTFTHKKTKKNYNSEQKSNSDVIVEVNNGDDSANDSNLTAIKDNSQLIPIEKNDLISFKLLTMNSSYSPQLSEKIIAKVLCTSEDNSQYDLKIIRGKEHLQEPQGKFSLPNNDEEQKNNDSEIITLNKSFLVDLNKLQNVS